MVEIKRQDITLSDWTKGISADEFAGGSYFYSEGIQSGYSTKGFKLGHQISVSNLNERTTGYPVAVCPCKGSLLGSGSNMIFFTKDGKLEMKGTLNGSTAGEGGEDGGGAIYSIYSPANVPVCGGFVYGDYALIFSDDFILKVDYKNTYKLYGQTITNPRFENSAAGWTVGSGWTLTDDGMKHTTGETGTLVTSANGYDTEAEGRLAIKIVDCTKGNVTVAINNAYSDSFSTEAGRDGWFVETVANISDSTTYTMTITPSSDFDGTIEAFNFGVYRDSSKEEIHSLTDTDYHFAVEWGDDIYIASGNTIDVLSPVDWTISDSKQIVREDEQIVAIIPQADSLIVFATNGVDSRQYYWNGVDTIPAEIILWKGQVIKAVTGTETICYVLAGTGGSSAGYAYRLYSVSGYQRSLIASNAFQVRGDSWNLDHYHPSKKFVFNDTMGSESMAIFMDNLYIPGCDGIYQFGQTIPGLGNSWSRPINYENDADRLFLYQNGESLGFCYRQSQRSYYANVVNGRYTSTGYLVTDSIYWDKIGTRKAIEKMKLGYKSVASTRGNIKIYAIVDDDYFWRFDVTGVSSWPKIGDVYEVANDTEAEIINIKKINSTKGEITFRTISNGGSLERGYDSLFRVTGTGDATLSSNYNYDNMCLIKTIETSNQEYGADLIFGKNFVDNYMPYWHKLQLVIELDCNKQGNNGRWTPEIYELSISSDIVDVTL